MWAEGAAVVVAMLAGTTARVATQEVAMEVLGTVGMGARGVMAAASAALAGAVGGAEEWEAAAAAVATVVERAAGLDRVCARIAQSRRSGSPTHRRQHCSQAQSRGPHAMSSAGRDSTAP